MAFELHEDLKVSVVIPCYNSSAFLNDSVQSVLAQTLSTFEIVLVDDGSSDGTGNLIEQIVRRNPNRRIKHVSQRNAGVAAARNAAIRQACGSLILPLDADDCLEPGMLEVCSKMLDADPSISIVYPDRRDFGDIDRTWNSGEFELQRLKYFNQIPYCTMFRKSMWRDLGGYRTNVTGFDDWDLWIAACARGFRAIHLPEPLLRHRRHSGSFLWQIVHQYEKLYAQIILNNSDAYSPEEVAMARAFLSQGAAASLLEASKFIFLAHYYQGNFPKH